MLTRDRRRFYRAVDTRTPRRAALGEPTIGWVARRLRLVERLNADGFAENIRTPVLFLAAGEERLVSTPAIERFALRLKNAACVVLPESEHEIMMERDEIRAQFWAAFDAFIPGEPFLHEAEAASGRKLEPELSPRAFQRRQRLFMHALVAGGDDGAALDGSPPSQLVTMPPAPSTIGISATMS